MIKKVLIVYASNSGSTFLVGEIIASTLGEQYEVAIQQARDTMPTDLQKYDLLLFGSPSWSVQGKEAFPHEAIIDFMARCADEQVIDKPCAAFGCGDSSYTLFCGAVNQLERFIAQIKGKKITNSLKIDGYFFNLAGNEELTREWARELLQKISAL